MGSALLQAEQALDHSLQDSRAQRSMLTGLGLLPLTTPLLQPTAALLQPQVLLQPQTAMQQQGGQWERVQGGQVECGWRCRLGL